LKTANDTKIAYTAVFEQETGGGWAAYVPDLPTVLVSGNTREEAERLVREGIELYIELLQEEGKPLPPVAFHAQKIEVLATA
jgi:predicted RNase H-like HicB family nuclease